MAEAVVVGSGPNGLAAAVALAQQGVGVTVLEAADTIGGGTRSSRLTLPGLLHDHCSAVHPLALASPFLRSLGLDSAPAQGADDEGPSWRWAPVELAHPLDHGPAAVLHRSIDATAAALGPDGENWRRLFGPLVDGFDELAASLLDPFSGLPEHPSLLTRFGLRAIWPAAGLARTLWRTPAAGALFAGVAAHAVRPLQSPAATAVGLMLVAAGHRWGWPVAAGGSRSLTDALAARLRSLGGTVETGVLVRSLRQLPRADAVLLDLAPAAALAVCGERLPPRTARAYARWQYGPAAFKLDLAVEGGIPWRDEACRSAGTVHVGGTLAEIADAERAVSGGRMPGRPFVLVSQQYLADPTRAERSAGDARPVWAYAHVPHGWRGDATGPILDQLERFAPGLRERILDMHVGTPAALAAGNPNYVGGDILTGANTVRQLLTRPRVALDPYATGIPGVFLCSAATPPGPGVHGMCGYAAARSALRYLRTREGRRS
jgi:phytoene dehydrogenase-like protein